MYLNKALIAGNLTKDPELKALPNGSKIASFSLATNRSWKNKDGTKQESVEYHNIVCFGLTADLCAQYLRKGQNALIEGRIQTRSWDKQDGTKAYRSEIVADSVQFGQRPKTAPGQGDGAEPAIDAETGQSLAASKGVASQAKRQTPAVIPPGGTRQSEDQIEYPVDDINPDDIPF